MKKRTLALLATLVMTATACLTLAGVALGATNVPAWWIDRGEMQLGSVPPPVDTTSSAALLSPASPNEYFTILLASSDANSGLGAPGLEFRLPSWLPPQYVDWKHYADFSDGHGFDLFVDRASHATDGIFPLDYRATDMAGNSMSATVPVKIDTRPPVTAGAGGWVNGLEPYALTAIDQAPGSGVAATVYRVDQSTPWQVNVAANVAPTLTTEVAVTPPGSAPVQGSIHTIDFGSVDAALPFDYDPHTWTGPSYRWGNLEGISWVWTGTKDQPYIQVFTGYQTRTVQLDVTAPLVTAMDPKNGAWQQGPAVVNFSGTDVGSGYAYTEWSTDGVNWAAGEVAAIGGDGETTVSYRGVDKVGLKSATQTIVVRVATTPPTVTAEDVSVKRGQRATFAFNVTAVTPTAQVIIQLRSKEGRTLSTHRFAGVPTNADTSRSFRVHLAKGTYDIRVGAVDEAGNVQTQRGAGTLTVR